MKKVFTFILLAAGLHTLGQQKIGISRDQIRKESFQKLLQKDSLARAKKANYFFSLMPHAKLSHVLSNGSKIYLLSQDNMSCIVPDMSQFNMPVYKGAMIGTIPNPATLGEIIPRQKAIITRLNGRW